MAEHALMRALLRGYVNTTLAYGFTRSVTYDYQHTMEYRNKEAGTYETKEMLVIDKIRRVCGHSVMAIGAWPFMLGEDLTRLECVIRGKNPREYQ